MWVCALTLEPRADEARTWIRSHDPLDISLSSWTLVEIMSGLSLKVRRGELRVDELLKVTSEAKRLPNSHSRTPISEDHFLDAQRLVQQHRTGLRSGDALHLAIAADFGLTVATYDKTMATAAQSLGLAAILL